MYVYIYIIQRLDDGEPAGSQGYCAVSENRRKVKM
jgi:hypothetical protein